MIELVALLPRKTGMSKEEFHRYWRERHGPLVVEVLGRHLAGYEQHHRLASDEGHDEDWDGQSYRNDWPGTGSTAPVPTPVLFTSPITGRTTNY